jgi:hypothetical protein
MGMPHPLPKFELWGHWLISTPPPSPDRLRAIRRCYIRLRPIPVGDDQLVRLSPQFAALHHFPQYVAGLERWLNIMEKHDSPFSWQIQTFRGQLCVNAAGFSAEGMDSALRHHDILGME